jgi:hypothetical protein
VLAFPRALAARSNEPLPERLAPENALLLLRLDDPDERITFAPPPDSTRVPPAPDATRAEPPLALGREEADGRCDADAVREPPARSAVPALGRVLLARSDPPYPRSVAATVFRVPFDAATRAWESRTCFEPPGRAPL